MIKKYSPEIFILLMVLPLCFCDSNGQDSEDAAEDQGPADTAGDRDADAAGDPDVPPDDGTPADPDVQDDSHDAADMNGDEGIDDCVIFASGFEPDTSITDDLLNIVGTDLSTGYSWDELPGWVERSRFTYIISAGKDVLDFMNSEIIEMEGPLGHPTRVLHIENKADDPDNSSTSRNEFSLFSKDPPDDYSEGHVRYWMLLQDNLDRIIPLESNAGWYMIMEWKEPNSGVTYTDDECTAMGCTAAGSNNYRINIGIDKVAGSDRLYWVAHGEAPQPCRCTEWTITNDEVPVPMGEWFQVEAYMRKDHVDGRVYFAVNGEVVVDTIVRTEHADNPLPLQFWSIFKLYHGNDWRALGSTNQWYDDLEMLCGEP